MAQPPLSAAIRQLEDQLGVELFERTSREVKLTPAGRLLVDRGGELLAEAERVFAAVREVERSPVGRLAVGIAPPARFGIGPQVLAACASEASGVMLYPREDTTGVLMRELRAGTVGSRRGVLRAARRCAGARAAARPACRPARRQRPSARHRRARRVGRPGRRDADRRRRAGVPGLHVEGGRACRAAGFEPTTIPDPYPDLGVQAIREGLGVVVYPRTAFSPQLDGSVFVPIEPAVTFPFDLLWRRGPRSGALDAALGVVRRLRDRGGWLAPADCQDGRRPRDDVPSTSPG